MGSRKAKHDADADARLALAAFSAVVKALEPLSDDGKKRVLKASAALLMSTEDVVRLLSELDKSRNKVNR